MFENYILCELFVLTQLYRDMTSDVLLNDEQELLSIVSGDQIRPRCSSLLYHRGGEGEISLPSGIDQSS